MQLEERQLLAADVLTAAAIEEPLFADFVLADVVGRHLLYNNSSFDEFTPGTSGLDDAAIAPDKSALLPGGSARLQNYSSFDRGINGVVIDVAGLPSMPTVEDFALAVGNTADASVWTEAPTPSSISVRQGAGDGGAARVTLVWPDGAIQNQWLRVTVRATARTGLAKDDIFYFGSLVGETGNSPLNAHVDLADVQLVRDALNPSVGITNAFDFDRNLRVDSADVDIAQARVGGALQLISPSPTAPAVDYQREQIELFNWGDNNYTSFYSPALVKTKAGTLIVIAEGRAALMDDSSFALVMRRSTDGGITWSPIKEIYAVTRNSANWINNGVLVVDQVTGAIFNVFSGNTQRVLVTSSTDDGVTWTWPVDITSSVTVSGPNLPAGHTFSGLAWDYHFPGPGHGIQMEHGPHAGRLIIPSYHRIQLHATGTYFAHVIYSDDHGATWKLGGGLSESLGVNRHSNEASIVELSDGTLYMSMRVNVSGSENRGWSVSTDGGASWSPMQQDPVLTTPAVQGTVLRVNDDVILFASPDGTPGRQQMTIWASYDEAQTWVKKKVIFFGFAGYADMTVVAPDTVLLVYNRGHVAGGASWYEKMGAARFNLRWLESSDPYEFVWQFNEKAPGATANVYGTSIQDYGPWDNRAQAYTADTPPVYVQGRGADAAIRLTAGTDRVILAQPGTRPLAFKADESFTAEVVMRTTSSAGVIIGSRSTGPNWTLRVVGGRLELSVNDGSATSAVLSAQRIDDGAWHQIAAVRDAAGNQLKLFIDGLEVATAVDATTGSLVNPDAVSLGSYSDFTEQLAGDFDAVRITRAPLGLADFLSPSAPVPQPVPPLPVDPAGPASISGLELWLSAFDRDRFFADQVLSDPLALAPLPGAGVHSALDASPNQFRAFNPSVFQYITYAWEPVVGANWVHKSVTSGGPSAWTVLNSNGSSAHNFDFVQNTGQFTLSTYFRAAGDAPTTMALFDTAGNDADETGFTLLWQNGGLRLSVGASGTTRFHNPQPIGSTVRDAWYHIAVVGNGPGQPVTFYLTPLEATAVAAIDSTELLQGANGTYSTDSFHSLTVGALTGAGGLPFRGQMVNQAIYNRALSPAEIQKLFEFGRKSSPNRAPTFTVGPNQFVRQPAGDQYVSGWAKNISAGAPEEMGQTLRFDVIGNTNPELFLEEPYIDPSGGLSYTPAPSARGAATITLQLIDDGSTLAGGDDISVSRTFTITVLPESDVLVLGDMDGNGVLDSFDIQPFELAVADRAAFQAAYPLVLDYMLRGDVNQDGDFDNFDLGAFESALTGSLILGDMNADNSLDNFDMQYFDLALSDPTEFNARYPHIVDFRRRGDMNQDGSFDNFDIEPFVVALTDAVSESTQAEAAPMLAPVEAQTSQATLKMTPALLSRFAEGADEGVTLEEIAAIRNPLDWMRLRRR